MSEASIPIGLGMLGIGSVLLASGITGNSLTEIMRGNFSQQPLLTDGSVGGQGALGTGTDTAAGFGPNTSAGKGDRGYNVKSHPELKPGIAAVVAQVLTQWPKLQITSTTGGVHAVHSLHYQGRACDLAADSAYMLKAAAWIKATLGTQLAEGIHNPNLSVAGNKLVPTSYWGPVVWAEHTNHIHLGV